MGGRAGKPGCRTNVRAACVSDLSAASLHLSTGNTVAWCTVIPTLALSVQLSNMGLLTVFPAAYGNDAPLGSDDEVGVKREFGMDGQLHFANGSRHMGNTRSFNQNVYMGRESERGFFGAGELLESDGDGDSHTGSTSSSEEADERPSELIPIGGFGGRTKGPARRRNRQRSSTKTGFHDFYKCTDENLGAGAYANVRTCVLRTTGQEYAVKIVDKSVQSHTRSRILREVDTFNLCKGHANIVQLVEWFEDQNNFYMVFEKMRGGPLLNHIQAKKCFTEHEASMVTKDIASALKFLHDRGIAHRDVKPENILCTDRDRVSPVKLCDLDLASKAVLHQHKMSQVASEPDLASPVGSAEFMAPEVVDAFVGDALKYDKRCDMWSLGVIIYIMLCGYPPFYGDCGDEECRWNEGELCEECQNQLFTQIQTGEYYFPEEEWADISEEAKDLIEHLLVKDVKLRYTADDVINHEWVVDGGKKETKLLTPEFLCRSDSTSRNMHQIAENFNMMNRIASARLSARVEDSNGEKENEGDVICLSVDIPKVEDSVSHGSPTDPPPCFQEEEKKKKEDVKLPVDDVYVNNQENHIPDMYSSNNIVPTHPHLVLNGHRGAFVDPSTGMVVYPSMVPQHVIAPVPNVHHGVHPGFYTPHAHPEPPMQMVYGQPIFDPRLYANNNILLSSQFSRLSATGSNSRGPTPPTADMETCQSAIARQDSKSELLSVIHPREQKVNV